MTDLGGAMFIERCRRHVSPVMAIELFRRRSFAASSIAALFFGMATGGVALANVLFLRDVWGYTLLGAGFGALPSSLTAMFSARFVGRMGVRHGEVAVGVPGALSIVAAMVWFRVLVDSHAHYWIDWLPGSMMLGFGIAAAFPMIAVAVVRGVGAGDLSVATATNRTFLQLGNAIGIAVVVAVLGASTSADSLPDFRAAWTTLAILGVVCATAIAVTGSTRRAVAEPRSERRDQPA